MAVGQRRRSGIWDGKICGEVSGQHFKSDVSKS